MKGQFQIRVSWPERMEFWVRVKVKREPSSWLQEKWQQFSTPTIKNRNVL
jgi:hypothetical protein